jgi:hypothetical protein
VEEGALKEQHKNFLTSAFKRGASQAANRKNIVRPCIFAGFFIAMF